MFDTATNLWLDAFLAGRGGDLDNDDNGNNDHADDYNSTVNKENDKDTNCKDNDDLSFLRSNQPVVGCIPGREGVISTMMTTVTTTTKTITTTAVNEDNDKDPTGEDNDHLIF